MYPRKIVVPLLLFAMLTVYISACGVQPQAGEESQEPVPVTGESIEEAPPAQVEEAAGESPAAGPARISVAAPNSLPDPVRTLKDSDSSLRASEKRVLSGDNYLNNLFERPFTSQEMIYQPDLDIITVDFAYDDVFFYFTIRLFGIHPEAGRLTGQYGVEFDRTLTGRGDMVVFTEEPGADWSPENVSIYIDGNVDVGGPQPLIADAGFEGSGYDGMEEMQGTNAAFVRLDPQDPEAVQFAISRSLLSDPTEFLWGAWADNGLKNPGAFDYNDLMGPAAAGSPFRDDANYPVKEVFNLDNTCRLPFGFPQGGTGIRGMCINTPPPVEKKNDGGCPWQETCYDFGNQTICYCIDPSQIN